MKCLEVSREGLDGSCEHTGLPNDDICHYHHIATKAYCLTQAGFGRGLAGVWDSFSRKVIGRSDRHPSVGHIEQEGILTNFSSTVISCVSCPGFSASLDVDVLVDLKTIRRTINAQQKLSKEDEEQLRRSHKFSYPRPTILEESARRGYGEKKETRREIPPATY